MQLASPKPALGIVDQIAEAMVDANTTGFGATRSVLIERGFSELELDMYMPDARQRAHARCLRDDSPPPYDRPARVNAAVGAIADLLPTIPEITMSLQTRGFPKPELDDILAEAITTAADRFAHLGGAS